LTNDFPVVKCEQRKENRHQVEWETEYSEYVNPASGQSGDNYMLDPNVKAEEATQETTATESAAQDQAMEATQESAEEGTTEG